MRTAAVKSSPLWMVTRESALTVLVDYLTARKDELSKPGEHRLEFSTAALEAARDSFSAMIRRGEERLHRLCELLSQELLGEYDLQCVVVGEIPDTGERFTVTRNLTSRALYSQTDLDLGTRELHKLQVQGAQGWSQPLLVANFVEYLPTGANKHSIHKFLSRIKAEEEIWNKVVDEIFHLDALVRRDKTLRHLSRYVKDVFGLKAVVSDGQRHSRDLQRTLRALRFEPAILERHRVPVGESTLGLEFLEVKDYLKENRKASGWAALKSVVSWWDCLFEIQIQALGSYHRERERLTRESHTSFKSNRESLRNQIAQEIPLFGFYRDLLRWLFRRPDEPAPTFAGVEIVVGD